MSVRCLDHYALRCSNQDRTTAFYTEVVGLTQGFRPKMSFPGVWLYAGEQPIVHVIFGRDFAPGETGAVDHLAFKGAGPVDNLIARLRVCNIEYSMRVIERTGVTQVFFRDPDNVGVEINFDPADTSGQLISEESR